MVFLERVLEPPVLAAVLEALDQPRHADRDERSKDEPADSEPGENAWLVYERDGERKTVELVTEDYPVRVVHRVPEPAEPPLAAGVVLRADHLRYAGAMGDVDVEVRGAGEVSVSRSNDEIVIDTGSATVVLTLRDEREE